MDGNYEFRFINNNKLCSEFDGTLIRPEPAVPNGRPMHCIGQDNPTLTTMYPKLNQTGNSVLNSPPNIHNDGAVFAYTQ